MSKQARKCFDKVVVEYICGDIKWLLESKAPTLGPFVSCIAAGIDTIGGLLKGFKDREPGSASRSKSFMIDYMGLSNVEANLIYSCVRCGYVHEGLGKLNVSWFADYKRRAEGTIAYAREDGGVAVNLTELAYAFLEGVDKCGKSGNLKHLPERKNADVSTISAVEANCPPIGNLLNLVHADLDEIRGSHSHEDVLNDVHYWQNDGWKDTP